MLAYDITFSFLIRNVCSRVQLSSFHYVDSYAFLTSNIRSTARPLAISLPCLLSFIFQRAALLRLRVLFSSIPNQIFRFRHSCRQWIRKLDPAAAKHNTTKHIETDQIHDIKLILDGFIRFEFRVQTFNGLYFGHFVSTFHFLTLSCYSFDKLWP